MLALCQAVIYSNTYGATLQTSIRSRTTPEEGLTEIGEEYAGPMDAAAAELTEKEPAEANANRNLRLQ